MFLGIFLEEIFEAIRIIPRFRIRIALLNGVVTTMTGTILAILVRAPIRGTGIHYLGIVAVVTLLCEAAALFAMGCSVYPTISLKHFYKGMFAQSTLGVSFGLLGGILYHTQIWASVLFWAVFASGFVIVKRYVALVRGGKRTVKNLCDVF